MHLQAGHDSRPDPFALALDATCRERVVKRAQNLVMRRVAPDNPCHRPIPVALVRVSRQLARRRRLAQLADPEPLPHLGVSRITRRHAGCIGQRWPGSRGPNSKTTEGKPQEPAEGRDALEPRRDAAGREPGPPRAAAGRAKLPAPEQGFARQGRREPRVRRGRRDLRPAHAAPAASRRSSSSPPPSTPPRSRRSRRRWPGATRCCRSFAPAARSRSPWPTRRTSSPSSTCGSSPAAT